MEHHTFLHQNRVEASSPNSQVLFLTEVVPVETSPVEGDPSTDELPNGSGLIFGSFALGILIVFALRKALFDKGIEKQASPLNQSPASSCSQCGYFNKSPYLKCAVHPLSVQKIDVDECPDFQLRDGIES